MLVAGFLVMLALAGFAGFLLDVVTAQALVDSLPEQVQSAYTSNLPDWIAQAKAVFVDCARRTNNIDPAKIEAAITPKTAATVV